MCVNLEGGSSTGLGSGCPTTCPNKTGSPAASGATSGTTFMPSALLLDWSMGAVLPRETRGSSSC